ncbi:stage II sporulation protein M [Flavobacterium piscis]|uniref:Membrane protein SpoIIM required for sporulation n=1 Tax=Flavobacterium piscis TaxID=1114874 RepID=A0ABU1YAK5_9FLAO|nr:stage II sporulation protein M [Flavobacterium piscis]MDR7210566.1 putative membrane protein SpoIIM required for sporulation [Flavobacterium piscis]
MKKLMLQNSNLLRAKRMFRYFLLLSFIFWAIPFVIRLFFLDVAIIKDIPSEKSLDIVSEITGHALKNDTWSVFCLIFINNLKCCLINIGGGIMLGVATLSNLILNGFFAADTFATIHKNGMGVGQIFRYTLPHCFELVGIWLSGAVGFSLAKVIIDYMRGKELPNSDYFKFIGKYFLLTVLIILAAAFVEAYISIPKTK